MSILSWNCQGAGGSETIPYLRTLRRKHYPDFVFLMETKQKSEFIFGVKKQLGYDHVFTVEPEGLSGGLALMWKDTYQVTILSSDKRIIDLKVTIGSVTFYMSCVYGDPVAAKRHEVWNRLESLGLSRDDAWVQTMHGFWLGISTSCFPTMKKVVVQYVVNQLSGTSGIWFRTAN